VARKKKLRQRSPSLVKQFGEKRARWIAEAHERDDVSLSSIMDRYNNEIAFKDARKSGTLSTCELEALTWSKIEDRTLVTIYPIEDWAEKSQIWNHPRFIQWSNQYLKNIIE
jgi:hypothetical protein